MSWLPDQTFDEPDPSPWIHESELKFVFNLFGRAFGKVVRQQQAFYGRIHSNHQHVFVGRKSDYVLWPPPQIKIDFKFDPKIPTKPPHSMTPPKNTVFDRRGRKRY